MTSPLNQGLGVKKVDTLRLVFPPRPECRDPGILFDLSPVCHNSESDDNDHRKEGSERPPTSLCPVLKEYFRRLP